MVSPNKKTCLLNFLANMAHTTPHALIFYDEESIEVSDLSLAREICIAFNISQFMNLLKHFYKASVS